MSGKVEPFATNLYALPAYSCDICHKYFNGRKPYNEHLQSNNHKKKLKEKAILDIASQEKFKPKLQTVHSDSAYKDKDLESKNIVDDHQYKKLIGTSEASKSYVSAGWNSVESSIPSTYLFPQPSEKEHELFYVECAVCQLYFTSQNAASMHFNSSEHKCKVAHHQEIEELYNSIKNIDIQEIVENLCEIPSLDPLEKNVKSNITDTAPLSSKQRIPEGSGSKLPLGDHMIKEKKSLPGCEICGITSFPSIISSLNHLSTTEHCCKAAMKSEATRLNSSKSDESLFIPSSVDTKQKSAENNHINLAPASSHVVPLNSDYFYRTSKQEEKNSDGTFLNPIGYERKQKQHRQSSYYPIEQPLCLPETYNFNYNDIASTRTDHFSQILLDPVSQNYKTSIDSNIGLSLGGQDLLQKCGSDLPQKCISKPFPRLAATFPQNNIYKEQNNIPGIQIINPDQDFSF